MKTRHYKIVAISILLLIGIFWSATSDRLKIDGFSGEIWNLLFTTDSKYADGYSDEGFNLIEIGMAEQEVIDMLGLPLHRWSPYRYTRFQDKAHFIGLQYSVSPSDAHYRIRQVYLDKGVVAEKIGYFIVD